MRSPGGKDAFEVQEALIILCTCIGILGFLITAGFVTFLILRGLFRLVKSFFVPEEADLQTKVRSSTRQATSKPATQFGA